MLLHGRQMELIFIGLFVFLLSNTCSQIMEPYDQCVAAAYCQMIYGDILKVVNDKTYLEKYMEGKHLLKRHFKYVACGVEQINKNCEITLNECIQNVQTEAIGTLKIPSKLIYGCEVETLPYMLFLCQNIKNWPNTTDFPKDFKTCHGSCSLIIEYNKFHLSHGKKESDFPKNWAKHIKSQEIYNKMAKDDKMKVHTQPPLNNKDLVQNKSMKNNIKFNDEWTFHSFMEPNRQDQFGMYTTDSDIFCKHSSYIVNTINELPSKFLGHCQEQSTNYPLGYDKIYDPGYYPQDKIYTHCSLDPGPPTGSFIIGMKFLIKIITIPNLPSRLKYLSAFSYLCSGRQWSEIRKPDKNEISSPVLICPYLTAICSLRFKRYIQDNGTSYITNIRIGCCTMPESLGYSGIEMIDKQYERLSGDTSTPQVWINQHFDKSKYTKNYCPFGQYLSRFDLARLYYYIRTGDEKKYIGVMKNTFYCNNFQINDEGILDDTLYNYLNFKGNNESDEAFPHDFLGRHYCTYGFFIGGSIKVTELDAAERNSYTYKMLCSYIDNQVGGEWNAKIHGKNWIFQNVYEGYPEGEYEFKCPDYHGICGLKSIESFYFPSPPNTFITLHGRIFTFICCPVPSFLSSRDCGGERLKLELEPSLQYGDCGSVKDGDTHCQVTHTIGYEDKLNINTTIQILKQFSISKDDVLVGITTHPNRQLGQLVKQLISNITFTKMTKTGRSKTTRRRQKRTPLTLNIILTNLTSEIKANHMNGISNNIPIPGSGSDNDEQDKILKKLPFKNAQFKNSITLSSIQKINETFTVYYGQPTFFYDVFLTCGPYKIYSDTNIRYISPTMTCTSTVELEYVGEYNEQNDGAVNIPFTILGYGLYIDDTTRHGLIRDIHWVHITRGVKQLFENNPSLVLKGNGVDINVFIGTKDSLWESYNPNVLFTVHVKFELDQVGIVYRVVASCGKYKVYTGEFITIIGQSDKFDIEIVPKFRFPPFTDTDLPKRI